MSGAMLMIAMALTLKVLGFVGAERKVWDRRQWAAQEAANVMEQITSQPFAKVNDETAKKLALSPEAKRMLPDAELKIEIGENDQAGGAGSKRVALQLRWQNRWGQWDAPVHLVAWVYRGGPAR
jgi:hypothetical protein